MTRFPVQLAFNFVRPEVCVERKAPIIFLHGLTASKESWNNIPQIVANATNRKAYVIDARNHGDSPWGDFYDDSSLDDLLYFMDAINAARVIVVGHSMGGLTAIKAALKWPERFEKIVVEDASVKKASQQIIEVMRHKIAMSEIAIEEMPVGLNEANARKFIMEFVMNSLPSEMQKVTKFDDYSFVLRKTESGRFVFKTNMEAVQKALENEDEFMSGFSGVYERPTCFIYGKMSPFQGNDEHLLRNFFPNAEFVGVEYAAHTVHNDNAPDFIEALLNFLQEP
ncbi:hypothetical protein CEXT_735251 [Caerostris extrusa]|uniref:sn-1-specific diacylglycerol lipase ABHD11 n=1 Tax=Caerostris extrusa TaxID=172846 RepID=A0AAV4QFL8_CAEEX|nr:hypothetical protein CEXT_735251 [Caerostris extrusa]